ncbi:MAG: hypothetical protein NC087_10265 [Anaeroplasma bactoclasticum]|nr:hypothetical protein [Anaeroplasma bactoclasticum]
MPGKLFMKCSNSKKDCFANKNDAFRCLSDTVFKDKEGKKRDCPFYKKKQ